MIFDPVDVVNKIIVPMMRAEGRRIAPRFPCMLTSDDIIIRLARRRRLQLQLVAIRPCRDRIEHVVIELGDETGG